MQVYTLNSACRPFDAVNYEDEIDEDEVLDEEGRTRMKLKVPHTDNLTHECVLSEAY